MVSRRSLRTITIRADVLARPAEMDDDDEGEPAGTALETSSASTPTDPADLPAHPIPGNPSGSAKTPAQRKNGPPGKPTEFPPESSKVHSATPDNSVKK